MRNANVSESTGGKGASPEELDNLQRSTFKAKGARTVAQNTVPVQTRKLVSYKDICVGINGNNLGDEDDEEDYINNSGSDAEEEDDELEEGDEEMVPQDPLCPVIKVSKQELKEACKPWKKAIIVKLLGK